MALSTAETISVKDTLALLDGVHSDVRDGLIQGQYAFWLGSGISRERVVGLDGVLTKLLEFLRKKITTDEACPHKKAMHAVLALASLSPDDRARIDLAEPVERWALRDVLVAGLWNNYSKVLAVEVSGQKLDYLLWEGVDFPTTFSSQEPDAEHLLIGMLALEGTVTKLASANWDGLLEAAMEELGYPQSFYRTTVTGEDLRGPAAAATLYKFHGCGLRAIEDEQTYRPLLIARSAQITKWVANEKFKIARDQLRSLAQSSRTLMIGMSAQDENIKQMFNSPGDGPGWKWNDRPTPIVFSANELGDDHRNILIVAYGEESYETHREVIQEGARIRAFAKPLLLAAVLAVLGAKLCVLANDANAPGLTAGDRKLIESGILHLRDKAADVSNSDRLSAARTLAISVARARHQVQNGESPEGKPQYFPVDDQPAHLMKNKLATVATGQREAALALGLIGLEDLGKNWDVTIDDPTKVQSGALRITSSAGSARVFFSASDDNITSLLSCGAFEETDDDVIIVCSRDVGARQQRSPSGDYRDGTIGPRYVSLRSMLANAATLADLAVAFGSEAGL